MGGVVGASRLPGACVDTDSCGSHIVRGVEASAELVDAFLPACHVDAVDGGGVGGERNNGDTFGGGYRGCLLRGLLIRRSDGGGIVVLVDDFRGVQACPSEEA